MHHICVSLCLTHVSVYVSSWLLTSSQHQLQTTSAILSPPYFKKEVGFLSHVTHVAVDITSFEAAGLRPAFDRLARRSHKFAIRFSTNFAAD